MKDFIEYFEVLVSHRRELHHYKNRRYITIKCQGYIYCMAAHNLITHDEWIELSDKLDSFLYYGEGI